MREERSEEHTADAAVRERLHSAAAKLIAAQRHAILLVEDTAAHAAIICRSLDTSIWDVEHVTRASAAVDTFEKDPARIVLLDLSLPDSDGFDLLSRLHSINAEAPIIVVTATDEVKVSVEAMQRGACDYVVKSDPSGSANSITQAIERAWRQRLRAAESQLVEHSRLVELVRAERLEAMESVVRTVCSEVNNPLSGVVALSQLLQKRDNLDDDLKRLADGIVLSASQVAKVVQKLRNLNETAEESSTEAEYKTAKTSTTKDEQETLTV